MTEKKSAKPLPKIIGFKTKADDPLVDELRKAAEDAGVSYTQFIRAALFEGAPLARARILREKEDEIKRVRKAFGKQAGESPR